MIKASELPLAADGSLYHIRLTPATLAERVVLVGDPSRVDMFNQIFDKVEFESINRELHAITGTYHGKRLTALSTGMGCDNIDIVMTELDAAADGRQLKLVRVGTSGSLIEGADCGGLVASAYAVGMDGLMNFYSEWDAPLRPMEEAFLRHMELAPALARPYCAQAGGTLLASVAEGMHHGITVTAPGFYGPQGRAVRLHPSIANLNERLAAFSWEGIGVSNLEMETSAIYGFSHMMGHEALTVCLIIANRPKGTFLNDYHEPMRQLLGTVVERLG
ncbi:MAG: nucleoside phosphorylase [Bacteroidales bacterium]|nr:nucleoside phosphorylase [Bacteroidales bacterium]